MSLHFNQISVTYKFCKLIQNVTSAQCLTPLPLSQPSWGRVLELFPAAYEQRQPRKSHQLIAGPYVTILGFRNLLKNTWAMLWRCPGSSPYNQNTFCSVLTSGLNWELSASQPSMLPLSLTLSVWCIFLKLYHYIRIPICTYIFKHGSHSPEGSGYIVCECVYLRGRKAPPPLPAPPASLFVLMMYETASPLDYYRNMTALLHHCLIMETDGTAPALFTLSTTRIRLVTLGSDWAHGQGWEGCLLGKIQHDGGSCLLAVLGPAMQWWMADIWGDWVYGQSALCRSL